MLMANGNNTLVFRDDDFEDNPPIFQASDKVRVFMLAANIAIALVGVTTNAINLIVFFRLGFKDSINISLSGLAVADFCICLTTFICAIGEFPLVQEYLIQTVKISASEVIYMTFSLPHTFFTKITMLLTASISFERCLCVTIPLKVKHVFTHGRVKLIVFICYLVGIFWAVLTYYINRLGYKFYPELNTTLLGHTITEDYELVNLWLTPLYILFFCIFLFAVVIVSTALLIKNLKKNMKWRSNVKTSASTSTGNDPSSKEKRVVKLVVIISCIYVTCFLPNVGLFIPMVFVPGFSIDGELWSIMQFIGYITFFLETLNSSVNMFVYYGHSSAYKEMYLKIFIARDGMDGTRKNGSDIYTEKN